MSVENRPNINAVGFLADIRESLQNRIRGEAGRQGMQAVYPIVAQKITEFVEEIDGTLDQNFGVRDDDR
jgi:hypothetical protein